MPWSLLLNKWVLIGFVVAGLGTALMVQTARMNAAQKAEAAAELVAKQWESNFDAAVATNNANLETLAKLQAETVRINAIVADNTAKYNRLGLAYEKLRKVQNDQNSVTDDWCAILDELRLIQGAAGSACHR